MWGVRARAISLCCAWLGGIAAQHITGERQHGAGCARPQAARLCTCARTAECGRTDGRGLLQWHHTGKLAHTAECGLTVYRWGRFAWVASQRNTRALSADRRAAEAAGRAEENALQCVGMRSGKLRGMRYRHALHSCDRYGQRVARRRWQRAVAQANRRGAWNERAQRKNCRKL